MGGDIGRCGSLYRSSKGLLEEFGPEQVKDAPISEAAVAGCGVGSALMGMRPIVEIMYIDFITIAMDQIVNQAAKLKYMFGGAATIPLTITTGGGGGDSIGTWNFSDTGTNIVTANSIVIGDSPAPFVAAPE